MEDISQHIYSQLLEQVKKEGRRFKKGVITEFRCQSEE